MSLTQTNTPSATSARQIAVPTPLPPPVTSAVRADKSRSDFHDNRDHSRAAARALVDEARERLAGVAAHRVEVGRALVGGFRDRGAHDLLGVLEQSFGLGRVYPSTRHDL